MALNYNRNSDDGIASCLGCAFLGAIGIALYVGLVSLTMFLWNNLLVVLFHWPQIGFWQTAGILLLLAIVGSFFKSTVSQ